MSEITIRPFNADNLYIKTEYSDNLSGSIFRLEPVKVDGESILPDETRPVIYQGMTYINGQPLHFEMPTIDSWAKAVECFAPAIKKLLEEIQSQQIQQRLSRGGKMNGGPPSLMVPPERRR